MQKVGGEAPTLWKGFRGPRGRPDPQNDRFPILRKLKITSPLPLPYRPSKGPYWGPIGAPKYSHEKEEEKEREEEEER